MLTEQWHKWEPIAGLSPKYILDSIINDYQVFKVILVDKENPAIKLELEFFEAGVYFEQKIALPFRAQTIAFLKNEYGEAFIDEWTFFKITNSKQQQWMSDQAGILMNFDKFQHLVLITTNFVVDLVTFDDAITGEFIDSNK